LIPTAIRLRLVEKTPHPLPLEPVHPVVQRALRSTGLSGALGRGAADEYDGPEQLVGVLLREPREELELAPILGRLYALASALRHRPGIIPVLPGSLQASVVDVTGRCAMRHFHGTREPFVGEKGAQVPHVNA
jgi:hypothetical protein